MENPIDFGQPIYQTRRRYRQTEYIQQRQRLEHIFTDTGKSEEHSESGFCQMIFPLPI